MARGREPDHAADQTRKLCYVVAPDGQPGGGMGRVKDYILEAGADCDPRYAFAPLITRDDRGVLVSVFLTARAIAAIWAARLTGRLALVHVNLGDRASALRKGLVVVLSRLVNANVVLHLHAVELHKHYRDGGPVLKALIRLPFRMASHNIVLGEVWRRFLVGELGVRPERVDVVTNGVPVPMGARRSFAAGRPIELLFLGNLMHRKGVGDLLDALARLPADVPDWRLTFAGGGDLDTYRDLAQELGLGERVVFAGWVSQTAARDLLAKADALVLPSYDEGLPLVILEALGLGAPVICTPVGAIPEVLADGETALFCKPGDPADLARTLATLMRDPELRQKLSDNGRQAYQTRFSLAVFMRSIFDVYRKRCGVDIARPREPAPGAST